MSGVIKSSHILVRAFTSCVDVAAYIIGSLANSCMHCTETT